MCKENNERKKIENLIEKLRKSSACARRECCYVDCNEIAISSHLLQRRGILSQLSEGTSSLFELKHDIFKPDLFYFKADGIKNTFSFPGFCAHHDTALFKDIENNDIDFFDYNTQLLFSYRALMNEKRNNL